MEYRLRPRSRSPAFPPSPLQKYLATPRYKASFNRSSYQYSPRSMHRVTYLNGQKAKVYNMSYLYPETDNPETRVDLIGKKNRLLLITPRRHRSTHDLTSSSPKKSLFESTTSHGSSSLSVPTSPFMSRRSGSEPYRSYSYQELYSPRSPSTPKRPLFNSRRIYSTSDLTYSSPTSRDRFYYDYPSMNNYRRWTSNYDISYVPDQYRSMDALYGYRKAGSYDVLYPPSSSFFDFRPFSRSESGYGGYEFRSRSGSGSIIRSSRSDIGDYHNTSRSEYDFPLRRRYDLGEYRPATRSECDFPVRHRGPESKSECGVSPNDIATRSESGFSISLSDFDNSFTMADDELCSISSVEHSHDRSMENLMVFPMSDDHERFETDSVVSHDRTLDIINEDENSDPDQEEVKRPGKPSASVSLLSRFEQADRHGRSTGADEDDDVFRQHTDTVYLSDGGNRMEEDELRNEDDDVLRQHTDTIYLSDGGNRLEEDELRNDDGDVLRRNTDTKYISDGGNRMEDELRNEDDDDVLRRHTVTIYLTDGGNRMEDELRNEDDVLRRHTDTIYLTDGANIAEDDNPQRVNDDVGGKSQHRDTLHQADGSRTEEDRLGTEDYVFRRHTDTICLADGGTTTEDVTHRVNDDGDVVRHHTDTIYFSDGANTMQEEYTPRHSPRQREGDLRQHADASAGDIGKKETFEDEDSVSRHHSETMYITDGANIVGDDALQEHEDDEIRHHTDTLYMSDGANTHTEEDKYSQKLYSQRKEGELDSDPTKDFSESYNVSRKNKPKQDDDTLRHHKDTLHLYDGKNSQISDVTDNDRTITGENNNKDVRSHHGDVAGSGGASVTMEMTNSNQELPLSSEDDNLRQHSDTLYIYDGSDSRECDVETSTSNSGKRNSDISSRTEVCGDDSKVPMNLKHGYLENQDDDLRAKTEALYIKGVDVVSDIDRHDKGTNEHLRQQSETVTVSQTAEIHERNSCEELTPTVPDSEDRVDNITHQTTALYRQGDNTDVADAPQSHVLAGGSGGSGGSHLRQHASEMTVIQAAEYLPPASVEAIVSDISQIHGHAVHGDEGSEVRQHSETVTISQTAELYNSGSPENVSDITSEEYLDNVRHQTTTLYIHGENVDVMADTPERRTRSTVSEAESNLMQPSDKVTLSQTAQVTHTQKPAGLPTIVVTDAMGEPEQLRHVGLDTEDRVRQHTDTVTLSQTSEIHGSGVSENVSDITSPDVNNVDDVRHKTEIVYGQGEDTVVMADTPGRRTQSVITGAERELKQHGDKVTLSQSAEVHKTGSPAVSTADVMSELETHDLESSKEDEKLRHHTDTVTIIQTSEVHETESSDNVTDLTNSSVKDVAESVQHQTEELYTHGESIDVMADTPERRMQAEVSEGTNQLRQHTEIVSITQTAEVHEHKPADNRSDLWDNIHMIADTPELRYQAEVTEETDQLKHQIDTAMISQTSEIHESNSMENISNFSAGTVRESVESIRHQTQTLHLHGDNVDVIADTPERRIEATVSNEEIQLEKNSGSRTLTHAEELHVGNAEIDKTMADTPERRLQAAVTAEGDELRGHTETILITQSADIHHIKLSKTQPNTTSKDNTRENVTQQTDAANTCHNEDLHDKREENKSDEPEDKVNKIPSLEERPGTNSVARENQGDQTRIHQSVDMDGYNTVSVHIPETDTPISDEATEQSSDEESDESDENVNEHRKLVYVSHEIEVPSDSGENNDEKLQHSSVMDEEGDELAEEASELEDYEVVNVPSDDVENSDTKPVITTNSANEQALARENVDSECYVQTLSLTDMDSEDRVDLLKSNEIIASAETSGEILETAESKFVDMSVTDVSEFEKSDEYEVIDGPEPLFTSSTVVEPADRHRYLIQDITDPDEIDEGDPVYRQNISAEYERADHDIWEEFIDEREVTTSSQVHLAEEDSDSNQSLGQRSPEDISDNTSDESDNEQLSSHRQLSQSVDNSLSINNSLSIDNSLSVPGDCSRSAESLDTSLDVNKVDRVVSVNTADGSVTDKTETIDSITAESRSDQRIGESVTVDNLSGDRTNKKPSETEDCETDNGCLAVTDILDSDKSPSIRMDENKAPVSSSKLPAVTRAMEMKTDSRDPFEIDERSRGEVEGSPPGKIEREKPGAEDRLEEADVRLVEADVDFVNQNELRSKTADQPRLKRWVEPNTDSKISTEGESSNFGEHENADNIWEEDIPGNIRLEVHDDSKHVTRRDAKLELAGGGEEAHVEEGERCLGREFIDTSDFSQSISPAANTDADSQARGNSRQLLETENVDYGSSSHPSEGSVPAPEESRVEVGGSVNRDEEIDEPRGGSEKNKSEESGPRTDGKTERREKFEIGNSSYIIRVTEGCEFTTDVRKTSEETLFVGKTSEETLSVGYTSDNLNQEILSKELTNIEGTSVSDIKVGDSHSQSENVRINALSTGLRVPGPDVDSVQSVSGAELSDRLISSDLARPTVKCALTTLAHSEESGPIHSHSNVTECVTETLTGESERNLTEDSTQIHYVKPNVDNRQTSNVKQMTASIEDRQQVDILNVTGGELRGPAIVEDVNVSMQQIHESPQPDLAPRVEFTKQDKMADITSSALTEGTDLRAALSDEKDDEDFGKEKARFTDRTEWTLPLEKKAVIQTRVQYRVKKMTKTVTKTDVDVKKVQKKTTGDAVEHEHLLKVEQLTMVSQKVWSSTESLDKDEPLEERCQVAYKATFDKTQVKDGHQLPSAHFETSFTGELPVGMQALHGESEDILALCGPEADNAESSTSSASVIQGVGIENSPEIHISQFAEGDVQIVKNVESSETDIKHPETRDIKSDREAFEEAVKSPPVSQTVELIDDSRTRSINLDADSSQPAHGNTVRSQTPDENSPDMDRLEHKEADTSANSEFKRIESSVMKNATQSSEHGGERGASPTHTDRIEIFISPKSLSPVTVRRQRWSAQRSFTDDKLICTLFEETVRDVTTPDDSALYILEDNIHLPKATERLETFVTLPSKRPIKPQAPAAKPLWTFELSSLTPLTPRTGQVDDRQTRIVSHALTTDTKVDSEVIEHKLETDGSNVKDIRNSDKKENHSKDIDSEVKAETSVIKDSSDRENRENSTQIIDRTNERKDQVTVKTEVYTEIIDNNNEQKIQNVNENSVKFDEDMFNQALTNILSGETNRQQSTLKVTSISHKSELYHSDENMNEAKQREAHVSSVRSLPSASDSKQGLTVHGDARSSDELPDTIDVVDARKFPDTDYTSFTETETYGDDGENYSIFLGGGSTEHEIERTEQFIRFETESQSTVQVVKDGQFTGQIGIRQIGELSRENVNSQSERGTVSEERQDDVDIESEIAESERVVESSERETITSGEEGDDECDETNNNYKHSSVLDSRWVDRNSNVLNIDTTETVQNIVHVKNAKTDVCVTSEIEVCDTSESHLNLTLSDSRDRRDELNEEESSETVSDGKSDGSAWKGDGEVVSAQGSYPNKSRAEREEGEDLSSGGETNRDSLFRVTESTDLRDSSSAELNHPTHSPQFSTHSPRCEIRGDNDSNISLQEGETSGGNDKTGDIGDIPPDHNNTSVSVDISDSHALVTTGLSGLSGLSEQRVFTSSGEWRTQIHGSGTEYKAVETGDSIDDQQDILSAPSAQVDSSSITSGLAYSESSEVGKLNASTSGLNSSSLESAAVNDGMLINGKRFVEQHASDQKYANVRRELDGNEISILKAAETFGVSSRQATDAGRAVTVRGELNVSGDVHANIGESDNESSDYDRDNKIKEFSQAFIKFSIEDLPLQQKQRYESMDEQRGRLTSVTDPQSEEIEYSSKMSHFDYDDWSRSETAQEQIRFNRSTDDGLRLHGDFTAVKMGDITSSDEINRSKDSDTSFDRLDWLESQVHTEDTDTWQSKSSRVSVLVTGQVDSDMEENNNYEKEMDASYAEDSDNSDLDTSGSQYSATVTCELRDGERSMSPTSLDERSISVSEHMFGEFKDLPDGKSRLLSSTSSDGYYSSANEQMTGELRLNVSSEAYRHYSSTSSEGYHSFISDQMTGELKHSHSSDEQKLSPSTFDEIEDTLNNSLLELENLSVNLSHDETDAQIHNLSDQRTVTTSISGHTQKFGEVHSSMRVVDGGETQVHNVADQRTVTTAISGHTQKFGEVHSSMRVVGGGETQIHNVSDQRTVTTAISGHTQKFGEVHSSMRVVGGGETQIQNVSDQRTVSSSISGHTQKFGEVQSLMRVVDGGETQIHNVSDQRTVSSSISGPTQSIGEIDSPMRVVGGGETHRSVHTENRSVRFVTENVQQSGYTGSSVGHLEQGQFQDAQFPSSEDRGHHLTGNTATRNSSRVVDSENVTGTEQTQVSSSQKYSSSDHVTREFEQGGAGIPTWSQTQGVQTVYTQKTGDQSVQRQFHAVDPRSGQMSGHTSQISGQAIGHTSQISGHTSQISGQATQFSQHKFAGQKTEVQYGGIISGNLSSEERRHQVGQGGQNTQRYSSVSSSMSDQSKSMTQSSQSRTSVSSEHSQHTVMSTRDTETYENVPESMSESVKDELLKKSHGYFSSSVSVNLSKKWKMFEKLYHSFDEFSWKGNLAPHLFTFVFQKSVENETDVVDQFEKLYPLLLMEDVERCQNHICTVLYTDTYLKQRKMQKYFLRGFTKDLKRLWHSKRKQSLAPLCDIPEERIVSFSDCASVSLPTCHTTSIHPSLVSFQPVAKPQFNRFLQQSDAVDSTSDKRGDNSFDSGEGNSCDSLQYICQGDLSDPTIMLSKRLSDLSRGDNSDILDDVLLRGLRHYRSKFIRFNPYMQVDRKGGRRTIRTETIYEEEEDERYMD